MELSKNCRGCKCAVCKWQGTDNCLHDTKPYCSDCHGRPMSRADRFIAKSWECKGFVKKERRNDR